MFSRCGEPFGAIAFCDLALINADGSGRRTLLHAGHWTNLRPEYSPWSAVFVAGRDRRMLCRAVTPDRSRGQDRAWTANAVSGA